MEIKKTNWAQDVLKKGISKIESDKKTGVNLLLDIVEEELEPVKKMLADYECAAMEIETKFKVLNTRYAVNGEKNPIESIRTRVKSADSIIRKLEKDGLPITIESVEKNLFDIAGVRVICSFIEDVYTLEKIFLAQEDVQLIKRKDYIENPKENGYRSLHLIVRIPIYTENGRKEVNVEVQMRTIAMDFWASLNHKLLYKKNIDDALRKKLEQEMIVCANESTDLDRRMHEVRQQILDAGE